MRKVLIACFVLFGLRNLHCQSSSHGAYHDRTETPQPFLLRINGDFCFLSTNYNNYVNNYDDYPAVFYRYNAAGELKVRKAYTGPKLQCIRHIFKTLDDKLLVIGHPMPCDYPSGVKSYIAKLDTNGNIMFFTEIVTLQVPPGSNPYVPIKCGTQLQDSTYLFFSDSVMFKVNKYGSIYSRVSLNVNNIKSIHACVTLSNQNCLLSGRSSNIYSLIEINSSGQIIAQKPAFRLFDKFEKQGTQNVLGRCFDNLYQIDSNYNIIDSVTSQGGNIKLINYSVRDDSVYSLRYYYSTKKYTYQIADSLLDPVYEVILDNPYHFPCAIAFNKDSVGILAGNHTYGKSGFNSISFMPRFGSLKFTKDVAMTAFNSDSVSCSYTISNTTTFYQSSFKATVWVKNNGPGIMNQVSLNCHLHSGFICGADFYQEKFNGLNVNPGDSVKLQSGWIKRYTTVNGVPSDKHMETFCLFVSTPDNQVDADISNDGKCLTINFTPNAVQEFDSIQNAVSVFPNPFNSKLQIQSDSDLLSVFLSDVAGRIVYESIGLPVSNQVLDLKGLPAGVYFIKGLTDKGPFYKKLIKQD